MGQKIYTKVLAAFDTFPSSATTDYPSADRWLLQEDIEVIGYQILARITKEIGNDGMATCSVEFSQVGVFEQDGTLGMATCSCDWNTTPAFGAMRNQEVSVMFPAGDFVPVKEEGYLHLNLHGYATGVMAATCQMAGHVFIFYHKKNPRRR